MREEILNKSPLQKYISDFDDAHIEWGYNEYWTFAKANDFRTWNTLFKKEVQFRAQYGLNFIWSVEGTQGSGKSQSTLRMKQVIDKEYGVSYDLRKFVDQIHFFPDDLEEALANSPKRRTYVLDEQIKVHGMMSRFVEDQLSNYEDTFRKPQINVGYVAPTLRRREHFFIFEAMDNIYLDKNGEVSAIDIMLKTRRKSDGIIMPRGILHLNAPEKELWDAYNEKKDDFIKKMQSKEGGMMARIEKAADRVIEEFGPSLRVENAKGSKIVSKNMIMLYMYKTLGTTAFTIAGYELVLEEIRRKL